MKVDDTLVDLILKSLLQKWFLALKRKEIDNFYFIAAEINESFKLNSEIVLVLHRFNLQSLVTYEVCHNLAHSYCNLFSKFLLVSCVICYCQMQRNLWADMMFLKLKTKGFRFQIHLSEKIYYQHEILYYPLVQISKNVNIGTAFHILKKQYSCRHNIQ